MKRQLSSQIHSQSSSIDEIKEKLPYTRKDINEDFRISPLINQKTYAVRECFQVIKDALDDIGQYQYDFLYSSDMYKKNKNKNRNKQKGKKFQKRDGAKLKIEEKIKIEERQKDEEGQTFEKNQKIQGKLKIEAQQIGEEKLKIETEERQKSKVKQQVKGKLKNEVKVKIEAEQTAEEKLKDKKKLKKEEIQKAKKEEKLKGRSIRRKVKLQFHCRNCEHKRWTSIVGTMEMFFQFIEHQEMKKRKYPYLLIFGITIYRMQCAGCRQYGVPRIYQSQLQTFAKSANIVLTGILDQVPKPEYKDNRHKMNQEIHGHVTELCEACKRGRCFARAKK